MSQNLSSEVNQKNGSTGIVPSNVPVYNPLESSITTFGLEQQTMKLIQ